MFKPADKTRRTPAVFQAYTKENVAFQLTLAAAYVLGCEIWATYKEKRDPWSERNQISN